MLMMMLLLSLIMYDGAGAFVDVIGGVVVGIVLMQVAADILINHC